MPIDKHKYPQTDADHLHAFREALEAATRSPDVIPWRVFYQLGERAFKARTELLASATDVHNLLDALECIAMMHTAEANELADEMRKIARNAIASMRC